MLCTEECLLEGHEELSRKFNTIASRYSDAHLDLYGFRPGGWLCACDYPGEKELAHSYERLSSLVEKLDKFLERG